MTSATDTMTTGWFGMMLVVMGLLLTPTRGLAASPTVFADTVFAEPQTTSEREYLCESDWCPPPGRGDRGMEVELETEQSHEANGDAAEEMEEFNEDDVRIDPDEVQEPEREESDSDGDVIPSARTKQSSPYPARAPSS